MLSLLGEAGLTAWQITGPRNVVCVCLALLTLSFAVRKLQGLPPETNRLTLEDLLSVESVAETVLSPDGKTFAATRAGQIILIPRAAGNIEARSVSAHQANWSSSKWERKSTRLPESRRMEPVWNVFSTALRT